MSLGTGITGTGCWIDPASPLPSSLRFWQHSLMPTGPCLLRFWGVRGSIPTPGPSTLQSGGNTSGVELRADGEIVILDAGTGIRPLGLALETEFAGEPLKTTILLSHSHWDHIQGFPFFHPAYNAKNRIVLCGFNGTASSVKSAIAGQMESPYFPVSLADMPGAVEIHELNEPDFAIGSIRVRAFPAQHPGGAMGYRLTTRGWAVVYMPDNEAAAEIASTQGTGGHEGLVEFIRDADVLVIDSQYSREEYELRRGWGHGFVDASVALALEAGVKRLELFHHDPEHDDATIDRMVEHARSLALHAGSCLEINAAREGVVIPLSRNSEVG